MSIDRKDVKARESVRWVVRVLREEKRTGILLISRADFSDGRRIYFRNGRIVGVRAVRSDLRLGPWLIERHGVAPDDVERAIVASPDRLLGAAALRYGLLSADELRQALLERARSLVTELLRWPDVRVRFLPNPWPLPPRADLEELDAFVAPAFGPFRPQAVLPAASWHPLERFAAPESPAPATSRSAAR